MCKSYGRIRDIIDERRQSNLHIILSNEERIVNSSKIHSKSYIILSNDEYIVDSHKSNK